MQARSGTNVGKISDFSLIGKILADISLKIGGISPKITKTPKIHHRPKKHSADV